MPIAMNEDHRALADVTAAFLKQQGGTDLAREVIDGSQPSLGAVWDEMVAMGWPGLHLPEDVGGQGFGLHELAIVIEQLGSVVAPGPLVPTAICSAILHASGGAAPQSLLTALATGERIGTFGVLCPSAREVEERSQVFFPLGVAQATVALVLSGSDVVIVDLPGGRHHAESSVGLDLTRPAATLDLGPLPTEGESVLPGARAEAERVAQALVAAEAAGLASACTTMARDYALVREQFGRPIGMFQAVKHHCANMLVDAELAAAAAWGAVRFEESDHDPYYTSTIALTQAVPAALRCAQQNLQVHAGIGYTWEHDAHLFLRRAASLVSAFAADADAALDVARQRSGGAHAPRRLPLPEEADSHRAEVRAFKQRLLSLPEADRRAALVREGYLQPHFPKPFQRGAGPIEQLVIEEELDDVELPSLGIGTWILPSLMQHGTSEQIERWVLPSLEGKLSFCQLFSEPEAGSDAAAIRTRGSRVEGGWRVSGQKIWTSNATEATHGLATVRTDPEASKHGGITMMVIDLQAEGVEVRPLRDITGEAHFNEIFLTEVFVPDEDVVGGEGEGWAVARSTLGNERVTIGTGFAPSYGARELINLWQRCARPSVEAQTELGLVVAEEETMHMLNLRQVENRLLGHSPGPEGNISKLMSAEHAQRSSELGLRLAGPIAASGEDAELEHGYLYSRGLTIGGGTSEISRNQIAEALLGLPRERTRATAKR